MNDADFSNNVFKNPKFRNIIFIVIAFLILVIFYFFPTPVGLTHNGQVMIGILFMAAILWITEPIPLPVTGAWTGSLAAVLFGLKFKHAFLSIFIGISIAGIIVTCLCLLGWTGAIIAGIGLSGLAIFSLWRA